MAIFLGTNGNDELRGGTESDQIFGYAGDDILAGNAGDDTIHPGLGADRMSGFTGVDMIDYTEANTVVHLDMAALYNKAASSGSAIGTATYGDSLEDYFHNLAGGKANDYLLGNHLNNEIYGGAGNDTINGRTGDDYLVGGEGADTVYGGENNDFILGGLGADHLEGNNGDDVIYGYEDADLLRGQNGNDSLFGNEGVDTITGGAGQDILFGGDCADALTGGMNEDVFGYAALSESSLSVGVDQIGDFQVGLDLVDLSTIAGLSVASLTILNNGGNNYTLSVIEDADFSLNVKTTGGVFTASDVLV